MAVAVPQHATATSSGAGDAVFIFPQAPQGQTWCGTAAIPGAPAGAVGTVTAGGELLGSSFGPGFYGPWTVTAPLALIISVTGLAADTQYEAVWHASNVASDWPAAITAAVVGTVTIPEPLEVTVENFPADQVVSGTVTANQGTAGANPWPVTYTPELASSVPGGAATMTGSPVTLPSHAAVQGVVLSSPSANGHSISLNGGFVMEPGQTTPLLPATNSDVFTATGTGPDVLSFLVI